MWELEEKASREGFRGNNACLIKQQWSWALSDRWTGHFKTRLARVGSALEHLALINPRMTRCFCTWQWNNVCGRLSDWGQGAKRRAGHINRQLYANRAYWAVDGWCAGSPLAFACRTRAMKRVPLTLTWDDFTDWDETELLGEIACCSIITDASG